MGMFDTIHFNCECGAPMESQSKGRDMPLLEDYDYTSVPFEVAQDANRHAPFVCEKCGVQYKFCEDEKSERVSLRILRL